MSKLPGFCGLASVKPPVPWGSQEDSHTHFSLFPTCAILGLLQGLCTDHSPSVEHPLSLLPPGDLLLLILEGLQVSSPPGDPSGPEAVSLWGSHGT